MKIKILSVFLLLAAGMYYCTDMDPLDPVEGNRAGPADPTSPCRIVKPRALQFVESGRYSISHSKTAIPDAALTILANFNGEPFQVGDLGDVGRINLGCVRGITPNGKPEEEYYKRLNLVLRGDSAVIIAYTVGGVGTFDMLTFVQYKGATEVKNFVVGSAITSVGAVKFALSKCSDLETQ